MGRIVKLMIENHRHIDFEIVWKSIHHRTTDDEEKLLKRWLNDNPEHEAFYRNALKYYTEGSQFDQPPARLLEIWQRITERERLRLKKRIVKLSAIISAAVAILAILFYVNKAKPDQDKIEVARVADPGIEPGSGKAYLVLDDGTTHFLSNKEDLVISEGNSEIISRGNRLEYVKIDADEQVTRYNTIKVPRGGEYFLVLSDSTEVWLNSETSLRYPVVFAGNERRVWLSGEAYFSVRRKEHQPFMVAAGDQLVRVLGTGFNVNGYDENTDIVTTLVNGKIELSAISQPEAPMVINPGMQVVFDRQAGSMTKKTVDPYRYIAWKEGRFVFQQQTLHEIMKTLSKWYDVDVFFASESLKNIRFTGNLERYENFEEILKKIEKTQEVKFEINERTITVK